MYVCLCRYVCVHAQSLSCVLLFATPWTIAYQAPLPMEFSRQEYWSGLPFPTPGDLPNPGIKPAPLVSPVLAGRFFTTVPPGKPLASNTSIPLTSWHMCVMPIYVAIIVSRELKE